MLQKLTLLLAAFDMAGHDNFRVETPSGYPEALVCAPSGDIESALLDTMRALGFSQERRFGNSYVGSGEPFDLTGGFFTRPIVIVDFERIHTSRGTRVIARITSEQIAASGYRSQPGFLEKGKLVYAVQYILTGVALAHPCQQMRE